jgi:hypothetical protein
MQFQQVYASGLGLILFSAPVFAGFPEGTDFMSQLEGGGNLYDTLVRTQKVVLLGTGSPQLTYLICVISSSEMQTVRPLKTTEFGLWIDGGLCIRDGYAPMDWEEDDPSEIRFPVTNGYYRICAFWMSCPQNAKTDMAIGLNFEKTSQRIPGDGWPTLFFEVR